MRYALHIAYVGTRFFGFQVQPNRRTVQGELTAACRAYFGCEVAVSGCSRTDRGVHARDFLALIDTGDACGVNPPPERLPLAMRPYLPSDLSVLSAEPVSPAFHVRHDVKSKEYRYLIHRAVSPDPFLVGRAWFYPGAMPEGALSDMRAAASHIVGTRDFSAFMAQGSPVPDTVRTVYSLSVEEEEDRLTFSVVGSGFLYNMVRIIVGTLIEVGEGRIAPDAIPAILASGERRRAGMTAPPDGLYLWKVNY